MPNKEAWAARRQAGLCGNGCGQPAAAGRARCLNCLQQAAARNRDRNNKGNICSNCNQPPAPNRKRCSECLAKLRGTQRRRRQRLAQAGLCIECARAKPERGYRCNACKEIQRRQKKVRTKRKYAEAKSTFNLLRETLLSMPKTETGTGTALP